MIWSVSMLSCGSTKVREGERETLQASSNSWVNTRGSVSTPAWRWQRRWLGWRIVRAPLPWRPSNCGWMWDSESLPGGTTSPFAGDTHGSNQAGRHSAPAASNRGANLRLPSRFTASGAGDHEHALTLSATTCGRGGCLRRAQVREAAIGAEEPTKTTPRVRASSVRWQRDACRRGLCVPESLRSRCVGADGDSSASGVVPNVAIGVMVLASGKFFVRCGVFVGGEEPAFGNAPRRLGRAARGNRLKYATVFWSVRSYRRRRNRSTCCRASCALHIGARVMAYVFDDV